MKRQTGKKRQKGERGTEDEEQKGEKKRVGNGRGVLKETEKEAEGERRP